MNDLEKEIRVVIKMVEAEVADAKKEYESARQRYLYAFFVENAERMADPSAKSDLGTQAAFSTMKEAHSRLGKVTDRKHRLEHFLEHALTNLPLKERLKEGLAQTVQP